LFASLNIQNDRFYFPKKGASGDNWLLLMLVHSKLLNRTATERVLL